MKPLRLFVVLALACVCALPAQANNRRFTYVYESTTAAPGTVELETWVTWKEHRFDFRHEIEFGLTDRLQLALYVADWSYFTRDDRARFHDAAVEVMYNLTNPETSALGSAIYGEIKVGDELVELEGKVILQRNLGRFMLAYNATLEGEWEGHNYEERNGEFQQTAGLSYQVSPRFFVGGELLHEVGFPEWERRGDNVVYAGPNLSVRAGNWWLTATALAQLTGVEDETDFQVRTIAGYSF